MRDISYHGAAALAHPCQVACVHNQIMVPHVCATLTYQNVRVASFANLVGAGRDNAGAAPLPLFDDDDLASLCCRSEQISLATQECRDLEDVSDLSSNFSLPRLVNVRENWDAQSALHGLQNVQAIRDARPTVRRCGSPIGFVKGGLKNVNNPQVVCDCLDAAAHFEGMFARLGGVGTGDEKKRGRQCQMLE